MNNTVAARLLVLRDEYREKLEELEKNILFFKPADSEVISCDHRQACVERDIYSKVVEDITDIIISGLAIRTIFIGR